MKKFLKTLRDAGILLKVAEGELKLTAPKGALTPELLQELKARKPELIAYLNAQENQVAFHAIVPLGAQASYALSPAQYRLWVLSQLDDALVAYNMPAAKLLTGTLDVASFEQALHAVVARHEILRTVFRKDEQLDDVRQFVLTPEAAGFALTYTDLSAEADSAAAARAYVAAEALRPFDLSTGPLFRAALLRLSPDELVFFFNMHHIISDGWSMKVLTNELLRFYQQCSQGQTPAAEPLRIQYKDFAAWQRTELAGAGLQSHRAYWLEQLQGELPVLELQQAQPRPAVKTYNGDMLQFRLSPEVQAGLKQLNETRGGTTFMGLVAALNTLLYRYTGQEDIILGSPIAGREHADLENQIGFYINTLALRTQFSANDSFAQLYEQVKTNLLGAYKHQIYPFDQLVDDLGVKRDVSRSPLFDVLVVMQNTDLNFSQDAAGPSGAELRIDNWKIDGRLVSKYDLTLAFTEGAQGIDVLVQYNTDLFQPAYIQRFFNHFAQLLAHIVQAPELPLHAFEYLSPAEVHRQTTHFNDNHLSVAQPATLHELFAQRAAALLPERAVVCDDRSLTYQQLDELSNQLAGYLLDHYRLQPNDRVGLLLARNEWYVVAVLATLKAGGAFVPIDLSYPTERISYMQRNSALAVVLDEAELAEFRRQQPNYSTLAPRPATTAQDLAYVIYTSGSTGEPKGVMIEHRAIVNTVLTEISSLDMQPGIRGMQFMSSSFDVSVWEIFTILLAGGELHIAGEALKKDAAAYTQYLNDNRIDIAAMPPVYLQLLDIEQLRHLRQLVTGGEETNRKLVRAFCQQGDYVNAYGPTEAAVVAAKHIIKRGTYTEADKIPIGKPIGNMRAYLLDAHGNLLPEGQIGQLYLGGPGLSRGYLNREELTAEKFVSNPFEPGALLYDTGDLARWTPDGELVFAGRKDSQVKIRGHRVELREIENALLSVPEVRDAVVLAREMSDQTRELVAYVVSPAGGSAKQLKAYLAQRLPAYMVPSYFVPLERLPTTSNGKINKPALPAPTAQHAASVLDYVAPANQIEETLVQIWQELLGKDQIGTSANFFDLGGNSIKIIKLNQLINAAFAKSYKIATFFNVVTIKDQAAFIAQDAASPEAAAGQEEQMEELVQSFDESLELFNN